MQFLMQYTQRLSGACGVEARHSAIAVVHSTSVVTGAGQVLGQPGE